MVFLWISGFSKRALLPSSNTHRAIPANLGDEGLKMEGPKAIQLRWGTWGYNYDKTVMLWQFY